jgi:hypothetical protein
MGADKGDQRTTRVVVYPSQRSPSTNARIFGWPINKTINLIIPANRERQHLATERNRANIIIDIFRVHKRPMILPLRLNYLWLRGKY